MISCYGVASEAVSPRICRAWKKFRELSGALVGKQSLSLKQWRKIDQCCVRPVLLHCCEMWELTVVDEVRLHGVEHRMIRMYVVRLVDRVSTNVLWDRVGVAVKITHTHTHIHTHTHTHTHTQSFLTMCPSFRRAL